MTKKREVTVQEAGTILGVCALTIQQGMKCGALDIGAAFKQEDSTTWTYIISAGKLAKFLGVTREEILDKVGQLRKESKG